MGQKRILGIFKLNRRYRYFLKVLLSFVLVLGTCLSALSYIVYTGFMKSLEDELENSMTLQLGHMRDSLDVKMQELNTIVTQIYTNPKFSSYSLKYSDGYEMMEISNELERFSNINSFAKNMFIYYNYDGHEIFINSTGSWNNYMFYKYQVQYPSIQNGTFSTEMLAKNTPYIYSAQNIKIDNMNKTDILSYVYPLPMASSVPQGAVIFPISYNELEKIVKMGMNYYNYYIYILDENNSPIVSFSEDGNKAADRFFKHITVPIVESENPLIQHQKDDYTIIELNSQYNNWKYMIAMPTAQYLSKYQQNFRIFITFLILIIILGLIVSAILAINNYRPINDLVKKQKQKYPNAFLNSKEELDLISQAFDEMELKEKELQLRINEDNPLLNQKILYDILENKMSAEAIQKLLQRFNICMPHSHCMVVSIFTDNMDDLLDFQVASNKLFYDQLKEWLDISISKWGVCFGVHSSQLFSVIFNFDAVPEQFEMYELVCKLQQKCFEETEIKICAGISKVHDNISEINQCGKESYKALDYRFLKGSDQIIFYEDIELTTNRTNGYIIKKEEAILLAIKHNSFNDLAKAIQDEFSELRSCSLTPVRAKYICFTVYHFVSENIDKYYNNILSSCNPQEMEKLSMVDFETIDKFEKGLIDFCLGACKNCAKVNENNDSKWTAELLKYVNENYKDQNLSLEILSSKFNLSATYLTSGFKEYTHRTLMHYIDELRMTQAKKLLINTDMTIKQIVDEVGYTDITNFMRKFKKSEGVTPTQFRNKSLN